MPTHLCHLPLPTSETMWQMFFSREMCTHSNYISALKPVVQKTKNTKGFYVLTYCTASPHRLVCFEYFRSIQTLEAYIYKESVPSLISSKFLRLSLALSGTHTIARSSKTLQMSNAGFLSFTKVMTVDMTWSLTEAQHFWTIYYETVLSSILSCFNHLVEHLNCANRKEKGQFYKSICSPGTVQEGW